MALLAAQLYLLLQRVLPKRFLTAIVYHLARIRTTFIKDALIGGFVRLYRVELDDVRKSAPQEFESLNDFFIRELKAGARPIDDSASSIVAPADSIVSAVGRIDKSSLLQAKGRDYDLEELLATDLDEAQRFHDGSFVTLYLAPNNCHRVHAPLAGELIAVRFVPGTLYSVNQATASSLSGLFTRNERLICHFRSASGPFAVIFVGALNVGSITTRWTGQIRPRKGSVVENISLESITEPKAIGKGHLLGWFNMGSTVIVLMPPGVSDWRPGLEAGQSLKMGEAIGRLTTAPPA